jgi:hypothetical protein
VLIKGDLYKRGEEIAHYSGQFETGRFIYHGKAREVWADKEYHIVSPVKPAYPESTKDTLYLLSPEKMESYRIPGTGFDPGRGQLWKHANVNSNVRIDRVVDDLVVYWYPDQVTALVPPVFYARTVDDFTDEFRYVEDGHGS